jgi:cytochrome c oxidase subunit 1
MSTATTHDEHHHGAPSGIMRWITTTKLLVGGAMAMVIRAELFQPGMQVVDPNFFNMMTTMHGLIMVFGAIMPAMVGLANWQIPMMIGAPDMALPRMNNWSFWILPFAGILLDFLAGQGPAFGWTMYAPLSLQYDNLAYFVFAVHMLGFSSIMGSINIIATVLNMRAPGMTLMKMPLFVWTWFITAFLLAPPSLPLPAAVTRCCSSTCSGSSVIPRSTS